jgi:hypothetical protein
MWRAGRLEVLDFLFDPIFVDVELILRQTRNEFIVAVLYPNGKDNERCIDAHNIVFCCVFFGILCWLLSLDRA